MELLSCVNCCHNPLQLGPVGLVLGYCMAHRQVLHTPDETTCGRLLRKDLLLRSLCRERDAHAQHYARTAVVLLEDGTSAEEASRVSQPAHLPHDAVLEACIKSSRPERHNAYPMQLYGESRGRCEVAWLSLHRARFVEATEHTNDRRMEPSSLSVAVAHIADDPKLDASDIRGPYTVSPAELLPLAKWQIVMLRLALVADIAETTEDAEVRKLVPVTERAVSETEAGKPEELLAFLRAEHRTFTGALTILNRQDPVARPRRPNTLPAYRVEVGF